MGALAKTLATASAATYTTDFAVLASGSTIRALPGIVGDLSQTENAAAPITTGINDGLRVLVLAFHVSDDRQDWFSNLHNIDADYPKFLPVVAAVQQ